MNKTDKIVDAMEYIENRFIIEAVKDYKNNREIYEETDAEIFEPFCDVNLDARSAKHFSALKKICIAAGFCFIAAGAIILSKSGLLNGGSILPSSTADSYTDSSNTETEVSLTPPNNVQLAFSVEKLSDTFNVELLNITDKDVKNCLKSPSTALIDGDKLYYVSNYKSFVSAAICSYDLSTGASEEILIESGSNRFNSVIHIYDGWLYYDYTYDSIRRINLDTGKFQVLFADTEETRTKICAATGKYLFLNVTDFKDTDLLRPPVSSYTVKRYNTETGETVTIKENAMLEMIHGDKLIYHNLSEPNTSADLYCCDFDGNGAEYIIDWAGEYSKALKNNSIQICQICSDGKHLWVSGIVEETDNSGLRTSRNTLMSLSKEEGLIFHDAEPNLNSFSYANGHLWWNNIIYSIETSRLFKTGAYLEFSVIGNQVFCFDSNEYFGEEKVYKMRF